VFEGIYKLIMRRNSIYVTFVIAGAFAGERVRIFYFIFSKIVLCFIVYKIEELVTYFGNSALTYSSIWILINFLKELIFVRIWK